jgi:hypothetical protein
MASQTVKGKFVQSLRDLRLSMKHFDNVAARYQAAADKGRVELDESYLEVADQLEEMAQSIRAAVKRGQK